jgi:hypothetical protein
MMDADGNRLTGAKRYTMTFQKTPPYIKPAFWVLADVRCEELIPRSQSAQSLCHQGAIPRT